MAGYAGRSPRMGPLALRSAAGFCTPEFATARVPTPLPLRHSFRSKTTHAEARSNTGPGDTVWLGAIDAQGRAVSFIQSLYHEFGCGAVLEKTGINWQNRGCSFSLDQYAVNALMPRKKPFHTLNPALALLKDGRTLVYGTMGGDGQPQTQAAVFTRMGLWTTRRNPWTIPIRASSVYPRRIESKKSALFFVARILSSRNSVASSSSIGYSSFRSTQIF